VLKELEIARPGNGFLPSPHVQHDDTKLAFAASLHQALSGSLDAVNDVLATPKVNNLSNIHDKYSVHAATGS
jgi:hypothetical protein